MDNKYFTSSGHLYGMPPFHPIKLFSLCFLPSPKSHYFPKSRRENNNNNNTVAASLVNSVHAVGSR